MQTLKACTESELLQSRQSTSCVLFQPAYVMCSSPLREFQTIKALAKTNFNIYPVYYDIRIHIDSDDILIPEPTARSAVPGVSPGRGLLIGY